MMLGALGTADEASAVRSEATARAIGLGGGNSLGGRDTYSGGGSAFHVRLHTKRRYRTACRAGVQSCSVLLGRVS